MQLQGTHLDRLRKLTGEAIGKFGLIEDSDRILVALSGGKDSFILLHLLHYFKRVSPVHFEITAGIFDPGYEGFNTSAILEYCRARNWEVHTASGAMSEILQERDLESSPCGLCSRLRRGKLYGLAKELKCNKLALGHHLDDLISSFFISLCRGQGLRTMAPKVVPGNPEYPVVIRPLALIPEELLIATAAANSFPAAGKCRYEEQLESGDRAYFRQLADTLAEKIPDFRSNFIHSLSKVELAHLMLEK